MELNEYDVKENMIANPHIKVDLDIYKNKNLDGKCF